MSAAPGSPKPLTRPPGGQRAKRAWRHHDSSVGRCERRAGSGLARGSRSSCTALAWGPPMEHTMADSFDLTHDASSGIAELVLNRPAQFNTMTPAFFHTLRD